MNDNLTIISATDDHTNFIFATWLNSFKYGSYFAKKITKDVYFSGQQAIIESILKNPSTTTLVCAENGNSNLIVGYAVFNKHQNIIHYIYIKETFRKLGLAKRLFNETNLNVEKLLFSHWTFPVDTMLDRYVRKDDGNVEVIKGKFPTLIYNPYLA